MRTVLTRTAQREEKKVYNMSAAQKYLGVRRKLFLHILASGDLPYRQLGRSKIFTRDALDRWLRGE